MRRFYLFTFTISTVKWLLHLWTLSHRNIFNLKMNITPKSACIPLEGKIENWGSFCCCCWLWFMLWLVTILNIIRNLTVRDRERNWSCGSWEYCHTTDKQSRYLTIVEEGKETHSVLLF